MWVRNNKGNVFVGNLPPDFSDERLAETFDPFGIVLSAVVARDPNTGARLRYGFVDIATDKAVGAAISALDGSEVDGCKLNVKPRDKAPKGKPGHGAPQRRPLRNAAPKRLPREAAAFAVEPGPPQRRFPPQVAAPMPANGLGSDRPLQRKPSQSEIAREVAEAVEPPPRRDFEVVRRPIRRTGTSSFQVERRPLPRRV